MSHIRTTVLIKAMGKPSLTAAHSKCLDSLGLGFNDLLMLQRDTGSKDEFLTIMTDKGIRSGPVLEKISKALQQFSSLHLSSLELLQYYLLVVFLPALFRATTAQRIAPEMKTAYTLTGGGVQHTIDCGMKILSVKLRNSGTKNKNELIFTHPQNQTKENFLSTIFKITVY